MLPGVLAPAPLALAAASGLLVRALETGRPRLARAAGALSLLAQLALALLALAATGPGRTLAFCCSVTHADFMQRFFAERGVRCVAVHSGASTDGTGTEEESGLPGQVQAG